MENTTPGSTLLQQLGEEENVNALVAAILHGRFTVLAKRGDYVWDPGTYSKCVCAMLVSWLEFELEDEGVPFRVIVRSERNDEQPHNLYGRRCSLRIEVERPGGMTEEWRHDIDYETYCSLARFYEEVMETPARPKEGGILLRILNGVKTLFAD